MLPSCFIFVKLHGATDAPCAKEPKSLFCFEKDRATNCAGVLQILQNSANAVLIRLWPKIILRRVRPVLGARRKWP